MKKFYTCLLIIVAIAALVFCSVSKGLQWFIGFVVLYACILGILKLRTNYITHY